MQVYSFSFGKSLKHDEWLLRCIAVAVFALLLCVRQASAAIPGLRGLSPREFFAAFARFAEPAAFSLFAFALLVCAPLFVWRVFRIKKIVESGVTVCARIAKCSLYRGGVLFTLSYEYEGETYTCRNSVLNTRAARQLKGAESATVLVNPQKPRQALIAELFAESE